MSGKRRKKTQDLNECKKSIEEFDQKLEELDGDLANLSKGNYNEGRRGGSRRFEKIIFIGFESQGIPSMVF